MSKSGKKILARLRADRHTKTIEAKDLPSAGFDVTVTGWSPYQFKQMQIKAAAFMQCLADPRLAPGTDRAFSGLNNSDVYGLHCALIEPELEVEELDDLMRNHLSEDDVARILEAVKSLSDMDNFKSIFATDDGDDDDEGKKPSPTKST